MINEKINIFHLSYLWDPLNYEWEKAYTQKQVILFRIMELIEMIHEKINIFHLSYLLLRQCKKKKDLKSFSLITTNIPMDNNRVS